MLQYQFFRGNNVNQDFLVKFLPQEYEMLNDREVKGPVGAQGLMPRALPSGLLKLLEMTCCKPALRNIRYTSFLFQTSFVLITKQLKHHAQHKDSLKWKMFYVTWDAANA